MIHLTHCRPAPPTASDAEMRELARHILGDGWPNLHIDDIRDAHIIVEALRRMSGRE